MKDITKLKVCLSELHFHRINAARAVKYRDQAALDSLINHMKEDLVRLEIANNSQRARSGHDA